MSQSYRKNVVDFIDKHAIAILVALLLAALALLGRGVYHLWTERHSWNVPAPQLIPIEMVEARRCAAAVEAEQMRLDAEMTSLSTLKDHVEKLLAQAPEKYRATAGLLRRYAEQEACKDMKHEYLTLADIWEAKALAAEKHRGDVRGHLNLSPPDGGRRR